MGLHPNFEGLYGAFLHPCPLPSVSVVVNMLLAEKTGLTIITQLIVPSDVAVASSGAPIQVY